MTGPTLALALVLAGASRMPHLPASPATPARLTIFTAAIPSPPYAPEEKMEFKIEYLGMKAGNARLLVGRFEGGILPVFLEARSAGFAAMIDVREQLASYLDASTGLPRTASIESIEPGYRRTDTTRFDRAAGKATVRSRGKNDRTSEIEVPPDTVDFIAMVFQLRTLPLDPGASHPFQVLAGTKLRRVVAEVVGRETVATGAGKIPAVKVRVPTGFSGKFSEKNPTFVWFSDDARRIVVRITTEFGIGRAVAQLISYAPGRRDH